MWATFRSLAVPNYRRWAAGAFTSAIGNWMQSTAQSWVVLTELTDNNALAVGVTTALQFLPQIVLVPLSGYLADRFDKRRIIFATQSSFLVLGVLLGVLLLTGHANVELLYAFALCNGIASAIESPSRLSIANELVPPTHLSNAVGLNGASFHAARLVGPAAAGLIIAGVGDGWVFIVNGFFFLGMLFALTRIRGSELLRAPRMTGTRRSAAFTDGFRYVWAHPDLMAVFLMAFLLGAFGWNLPIFAATMSVEFGEGAGNYGVLSSVVAIGSLSGALFAARAERPRLRRMVIGMALFGLGAALASVMPSFWAFAAMLVIVGFALPLSLSTANSWVQLSTDAAVRGRVIAIYFAVSTAGIPLGALVIGWMADGFGPRWPIALGAAAGLLAALIGLWWFGLRHRLQARAA